MTSKAPQDVEAQIKRLRTRVDVLYVGLGTLSLAAGGIAFAKDVVSLGLILFMLTAAFIAARYQDAQYANQLESDEKKRLAGEHTMKVVEALTDRLCETIDEQRKAIENISDVRRRDDSDDDDRDGK